MKANHNNRKLKRPDASSSKTSRKWENLRRAYCELILEEIIGLTTKSANGLASSYLTSKCAYIAGCVVVVYNVDSGIQSHLMVSHRVPKPLSCVAVSHDGRFVAAGESGHQPAVLIWDSATSGLVSELKGHQYGIVCTAFSPNGKHLVSVGFPHDGFICIWDWQSGLLAKKVKSSSSCSAVSSTCFSSDAKSIVTSGGKKHLKFWSIGSSMSSATRTGTLTMHGKTVNFDNQKGSSLVAVVSPVLADGSSQAGELLPIYALTDAGTLCLLNSEFAVERSVDLKVGRAFALSASDQLIACGCSNGTVILLNLKTLNYVGSLLYSEAKICHDPDKKNCNKKVAEKDSQLGSTLPDATACQFSTSNTLVVVYGDHSLYIWDVRDVCEATRCCVLASHSACIWDIKNVYCEYMHDPSLACAARGCSGGVSFATCSADGTIRLWDLVSQSEDIFLNLSMSQHSPITAHLVSAGTFERDTVELAVGTQGFRSIAVSADGNYMAAGDCQGNLHIFNLKTSDYTCVQDAHDAEILSLCFSVPTQKDKRSTEKKTTSNSFLASGGRDRIINLYDVERNFDLVESIDDHSAAVTSVNITCNGSKILSCSADRSLMFRDIVLTDTGYKVSRRHYQMASNGTVYDMVVDPTMEVVITVGQDKKINTFSIAAGKLIKSFKQNGNFGDPIKITMDPSCSYLLCSYSNKSICMYDFVSGEMVTQAMGHGEVVTGVIFLPDCKHIISVGGDGCIFLWKLPPLMSSKMLQKLKENLGPLSPSTMINPLARTRVIFHEVEDRQNNINPENNDKLWNFKNDTESVNHQKMSPQTASAFRFSISRLPRWAQDKVSVPEIFPGNRDLISSQQEGPSCSELVANGERYSLLSTKCQTPSRCDVADTEQCNNSMSISSSDTENNLSSTSTPQRSFGHLSMGRRWHSIHTVCLDLLNSPEVGHFKEENTTAHNSKFCGNEVESASYDVTVNEISEQLKPKSSQNEVQAIPNVMSEDNDLFNQHFGNLSTMSKIESRKSSAIRRYSSRFIVRRDNTQGCSRMLNTFCRDVGGNESLKYRGCVLDAQSLSMVEEQKETDSEQDSKKSTRSSLVQSCSLSQHESTQCSIIEEDTSDMGLTNAGNYRPNEIQDKVIECNAALQRLDSAAESAHQLFSNLRNSLAITGSSNGLQSQLYKEAAGLLPSIVEKVHAMSNMFCYTINFGSWFPLKFQNMFK